MNEITFKLPDDAMRRVVKLNEKEYELKEAMNCPIGRDVTARMFNEMDFQGFLISGKNLRLLDQRSGFHRCDVPPQHHQYIWNGRCFPGNHRQGN